MDNIISIITKRVGEKSSSAPYYNDKKYKPIEISKNNFHVISESFSDNSAKISFIDGGNIEIAGNKNFSMQLLRVYHNVYPCSSDNRKLSSEKSDFIAIVYLTSVNGKMQYKAEIYKLSDSMLSFLKQDIKSKSNSGIVGELVGSFSFDAYDKGSLQEPSTIIDKIRRLMEIREITSAEKNNPNAIVLDGSLRCEDELENQEMVTAISSASEKGIGVYAIQKSSSAITDSGANLVGYIHNLGKSLGAEKWYYYPICVNENPMHPAEVFIAKFHSKSNYAFAIDIEKRFCNSDKAKDSLFAMLAINSKDGVFIGYPYGLVDADSQARCTEEEKRFLQIRLMALSGDSSEDLRRIINTGNAHDVLDSIR